jgi:hypothetical protein
MVSKRLATGILAALVGIVGIAGTAAAAAVKSGVKIEPRRPVLTSVPDANLRSALAAAAAKDVRPLLTPRQRAQLTQVIAEAKAERSDAMVAAWKPLVEDVTRSRTQVNVAELVMQVLRESVLESSADTKYHLERLRRRNAQAAAISAMTADLAKAAQALGGKERAEVALPDPRRTVLTADATRIVMQPKRPVLRSDLDAAIAHWEEQLRTTQDLAKEFTLQLQDTMQKRQQALALFSKLSKMLDETAQAIIQNQKA